MKKVIDDILKEVGFRNDHLEGDRLQVPILYNLSRLHINNRYFNRKNVCRQDKKLLIKVYLIDAL